MKHKFIKFIILILLILQCCVAYAIDTDEGEIILGIDDMPYITEIYSRKELQSCTKLKLVGSKHGDSTFCVEDLLCMPNIEELYVAEGAYLDDYSKLKAFQNLRSLSLSNQNISDISFVSYLKWLEEVDFQT